MCLHDPKRFLFLPDDGAAGSLHKDMEEGFFSCSLSYWVPEAEVIDRFSFVPKLRSSQCQLDLDSGTKLKHGKQPPPSHSERDESLTFIWNLHTQVEDRHPKLSEVSKTWEGQSGGLRN